MTFGLKYNNKRIDEKTLCDYIPVGCGYPKERISSQLNWILDNCTDINDLDCENVLQGLWYDVIGIYNDNIEKTIHELVEKLVDSGKIARW